MSSYVDGLQYAVAMVGSRLYGDLELASAFRVALRRATEGKTPPKLISVGWSTKRQPWVNEFNSLAVKALHAPDLCVEGEDELAPGRMDDSDKEWTDPNKSLKEESEDVQTAVGVDAGPGGEGSSETDHRVNGTTEQRGESAGGTGNTSGVPGGPKGKSGRTRKKAGGVGR